MWKAILLIFLYIELAAIFVVTVFVAFRYYTARFQKLTDVSPPFFCSPRIRPRVLNCPDYPDCWFPQCDCYGKRDKCEKAINAIKRICDE